MSILSRLSGLLFRREDVTEAPAPTARRSSVRRGGVLDVVTPYGRDVAMSVATAYRCMQILSDSVASLPLQHMRKRGGIFVDDHASRLHYLLNVEPDQNLSAFDFWRSIVLQLLLDGNAYVVPVYSSATMDIDRLALCGRGTVAHDSTTDTYRVSDFDNGVFGNYSSGDIIHVKGQIAGNPKRGVGVVEYARLSLGIASVGDTETHNRFANGGNVRGLVTNDTSVRGFGEYQDSELEKTAENLDDRFRGGERIVSLPGQVDFKPLSLSSTDMQFLESRKFTVREICRFFGVHPSRVFDDTSTNYKSVEMGNVDFLSSTLNPLLRNIEAEFNRKIVGQSGYGKRKIQFDRRGLYACDLDSRVKYQAQTIGAGLYTVNEWRAEENKPPVEGGDRVLVSANLKDINDVGVATQTSQSEKTDPVNEDQEEKNENE